MKIDCWEALEHMHEPVVVSTPEGETIEANRAFRALAEGYGMPPSLQALFGPGVAALLAAAGDGARTPPLPVVAGEPRTVFRLSVARMPSASALTVVLNDAGWEVASRRLITQRDRTLETLRDIGSVLSGVVDLDRLTERMYEQTRRIIPTRNFYVALHDRERETIAFPRYIEDDVWKDRTSRPFGRGLTEHVIVTRAPLVINRDVRGAAEALGIDPQGRRSLAWMGVPLVSDGEVIGMIGIQDFERADCYGTHDTEALGVIASQAAAAIRNARLIEAERSARAALSEAHERLLQAERLRVLTETVGALNHEVNNPLAAIVGFSQLLARRELPADVHARIVTILTEAKRIEGVTARMGSLIQAASAPYPGDDAIIDVRGSVSAQDRVAPPPSNGH